MNASVSYRYFKHPRPNLTKIGQNEVLFLTLPHVTLPFTLQHKQRNVRCYLKSFGWLALTYACSRSPVSEVPRLLRSLYMSLVTETNFSLGSYEKVQPCFRDELKANDPGDEFWHQGTKKADMRNTKIITFAPIIAFATLKAVSLQLIAMLMIRKIQQANARRCHLGQNSSCFNPGITPFAGVHQMEPPSPIQALGVNPFPSRFIIRTVPRGDFARRQWEEPITKT